jgi:hypothetical protein
MDDQQILKEMISVYTRAIPEMKSLGEIDWCNEAHITRKRIASKLYQGSNLALIQLARECHADLQGYVQRRFGSSVMDAKDCYDKGCFALYLLSQCLIQIGGSP